MLCALAPTYFEHCMSPVLDAREGKPPHEGGDGGEDVGGKGEEGGGEEKRETKGKHKDAVRAEAAGAEAAGTGTSARLEAADRTAKERMRAGVLVGTSLVTCLAFLAR